MIVSGRCMSKLQYLGGAQVVSSGVGNSVRTDLPAGSVPTTACLESACSAGGEFFGDSNRHSKRGLYCGAFVIMSPDAYFGMILALVLLLASGDQPAGPLDTTGMRVQLADIPQPIPVASELSPPRVGPIFLAGLNLHTCT